MTSQPPSFRPDRRRARPTSSEARPASGQNPSTGQGAAEGAQGSAPQTGYGVRPSAQGAPMPVFRERPKVYGVAADGAGAKQWRVDAESGEAAPVDPHKPLIPTTADQPSRPLPPSFAPAKRASHAESAARAAAQRNGDAARGGAGPAPSFAPTGRSGGRPSGASSARPGAVPGRPGPQAGSAAPRPIRSSGGYPTTSVPPSTPVPRPDPARTARPVGRPKRRSPLRRIGALIAALLVLVLVWTSFLLWDANQNLGRTQALSGAANTAGTTYLLAGSDSRADGAVKDGFEGGERSDSIMLVNIAPNGQTVTLSIPRDTYAKIPGYGWDKINAAYSYGGSALLVEAVENLTGLTVDHYVQIGMGGVADIVDAVGGINACYDGDVAQGDPSGLEWTAGCHDVDGTTALAFSRMRYSDPEGDIGRTKRQRQVISKVVSKALSPSTLINPAKTLKVERAGSASFTVDESDSVLDVAKLVLAFRSSSKSGLMGTPPIESLDYTTDAGGSAVLLQDTTADDFFAKLRSGSLTTDDLNVVAGY
ncbi:LCP family protein [Actinomyces culturomici]|uniref:LCP family protein n=1 Tax=Actinomyces culturomici TaxID=1926276 RepID=UPI001F2EB7C4|nr:LCP family protein [Actinomyces culturomici]